MSVTVLERFETLARKADWDAEYGNILYGDSDPFVCNARQSYRMYRTLANALSAKVAAKWRAQARP